ncbi:hypothetical protein EUTSA_v10009921mg, partial [Eutrema salsugineum]
TKIELDPKKYVELPEKIEAEADEVLVALYQMVENDRKRNVNREALTALTKKARTTKTSVPSPFNSMMKDVRGSSTEQPMVKEVCSICGSHGSTDLFAAVSFHVVHTSLKQKKIKFEATKLQSLMKEKTLCLSELVALGDSIPPGIIRSLVTLEDKPKVK